MHIQTAAFAPLSWVFYANSELFRIFAFFGFCVASNTDVYMYEISDSNKYAIVAVGRDDGSINALSVKDIDSQWSEDNKYEYILKNE